MYVSVDAPHLWEGARGGQKKKSDPIRSGVTGSHEAYDMGAGN